MKIAIIGGGISGLVAGYRLRKTHEVKLFEANHYVGGHTNTIDVAGESETGREENFAVDTGFIVYNDRTYPLFIRLLDELGVDSQPTRMSFSVSCEKTGLEYRGADPGGLFAQRKNFFNPRFYRLLYDFARFNRLGSDILNSTDESETVAAFLKRNRFSEIFVEQYFMPMGAAIWSAPFKTFAQFPIRFIAEFYRNHGLLGVTDRPQWRVIKGGSRSYIQPLIERWQDSIHLNSPVRSVTRLNGKVQVKIAGQSAIEFDHVIFACHADQALRILDNESSNLEREVLSAFPYQPNTAILHTQSSVLPKNRRAWACWNYFNPRTPSDDATVTYNMNMLQSLPAKTVFCVTLNDKGRIRPENIIQTFKYDHPVFDVRRKAMQDRHPDLIDCQQTSFCGAYWGNGFHEDGVRSATAVTERLISIQSEVAIG